VRFVRALVIYKLGALAGLVAAAVFVKRAVPSVGDEDSNELSLVAILDGVELASRAKAFKGGSMLAWFGGVEVDLREAELAPGARLSVNAFFGGIEIRTPPSWRVESNLKALAGGVETPATNEDRPDAPALTIEGMALFGGIEVSAEDGDAAAPGDDDTD
jgi:hypothetical protein